MRRVLVTFRDHNTGLEYIRHNRQIHKDGLYIELDAYQYHIFMDFQEIEDNEWHQYSQLRNYLNGRGVPSIAEALQEIFLQPLHYPIENW
jgi:predicted metal-dependent HD superfamily phosphohydrolase